ncbi:MAG: patatin-like phospholipase family protein [Pseudomonadota bacterium]
MGPKKTISDKKIVDKDQTKVSEKINLHSYLHDHAAKTPPRTTPSKGSAKDTRLVSLALQGGGSHGAYTWGVLDRLLEEENLEIEGISGTSAGAMNAAVMVDGYIKNGRPGAKEGLRNFWSEVSRMGQYSPMHNSPFPGTPNNWNLDSSPAFVMFDIFTRLFSPYQINPMNINPLKNIVENLIDFDALQKSNMIDLFVTATSVTTGQPHVFHHKEITIDTIMGSACLPSMFQAVKIGDDHYWDGGYAGNPSIWPLTYHSDTSDIVVVEINPVKRETLPMNGNDVANRVNEIAFNASLISEIRSIHLINTLIEKKHVSTDRYRKLHIHLVEAPDSMLELNASSKVNTSWEFLEHLKELGRKSAEKWLKLNFEHLGVKSSVDIYDTYLKHRKHPFIEVRRD